MANLRSGAAAERCLRGGRLVPVRLSLEDVRFGIPGYVRERPEGDFERGPAGFLCARFTDEGAKRVAAWANSSAGEEFCFGPGTLAFDREADAWLECLDPSMEQYRKKGSLVTYARDEEGLFEIGYDWLWVAE